jgi:hypothetical protein
MRLYGLQVLKEDLMKMFRFVVVLLLVSPALAWSQGLEITAYGGYNTGGSLDVREADTRNKLYTAGSFSTGLSLTWTKSPTYAFELFWGWRPTDLEGQDPTTAEKKVITSFNEHDFHANFLFSPYTKHDKARPFLLLGLGATYLVPGTIENLDPEGALKFSWAIGAGLKGYLSERFGLRGQARYHSTYIADEAGGTWCDYYYGCYTTVDTNWLDEWDFQVGIIILTGK